ncbi:LuxR C-terminal-related transcriptional regulator [Flammeovirga pacifica]|uniref:HTH luxR-type domain-containing protein n=1 Tax=Flammeovirga pacifica TaxID=915059 RepID=A0A1S1Z001_FLAPC|nr:LuxR C-terminal-related transcriptional regulator [Flammeovirga pacifica]OHX66580.1 hypothetical protein NH26_09525 [Flammeovirga pacifica]
MQQEDTINQYIKTAKQLERLGSCVTIFDYKNKVHPYISKNYERIFGWDFENDEELQKGFMDKEVHPEDIKHLNEMAHYFLSGPLLTDDKKDFFHLQYVTEYRIRNAHGNYVWVIEKHLVLDLSEDGSLRYTLGILDQSVQPNLPKICSAQVINTTTGSVKVFPREQKNYDLSKREIEVLKEIGGGLLSKQISDKLNISVNTVNTHRQNIISKMNVGNTTEAVQVALSMQLI